MKTIRRRCCNGGWWPVTAEIAPFNPDTMRTMRYRIMRLAESPVPG
jgi:RNA-directed DNA polymerase